jgi:hypothetical protein
LIQKCLSFLESNTIEITKNGDQIPL